MKNQPENSPSDEVFDNLPVQSENIAFNADEMTACRKCSRQNPPTRLRCLYCGAELEISVERAGLVKPVFRRPEAWEKGFNLILLPAENGFDDRQRNEIARCAGFDEQIFGSISQMNTPLPVARVESEKEAATIGKILERSGVETVIVADEILNAEKLPKRLRGLEFAGETLRLNLFNSGEVSEIAVADVLLIVAGAVFERKVDATEKRSRKGEIRILNATETASDEMIIDLYVRGDEKGFRIEQKGFDFSCLGENKQMLAARNMRLLIDLLGEFAPGAKVADDYLKLRHILGIVWDVEERKNSRGLVRESFGKFNLGNVTTVSNLRQFTKYSRLRKHLL